MEIYSRKQLTIINENATKAMEVLENFTSRDEPLASDTLVAIKVEDLFNLASTYLFLYNKTMEAKLMPCPRHYKFPETIQ